MGQSSEQLGEDVRVQGGQGSGAMTELIFDPITGEFVTKPEGSSTDGSEMNTTGMTRDGFYLVS